MSDNMNGDPIKQALKDFVATSNSGKYKSEDELMSKFPELSGYDRSVLKDFVATSNSGKYKSEDELFSKFPEFSSPVKKKDSLEPVGGGDGVLGAAKKAAEAKVASPSSPQQPKPVGTSVKSAATGLGSALPSPLKSESESGKEISGEATLASPIQQMSGDEAEVGYIEPPNIERVKTRNEFAGRESQARTALYNIQSGKTPSYVDASVLLELSNKGVFEDENVNDFQRKVQERQKIAVPKIEKLKADYIDNAQTKITEKLKKDPEYVSFNSALQSDIDAYAKSLVSAATMEIEQYSSVAKSQAELDAFYKQKAAEVDGAIKQYTDQKLSETSAQYKIFQEKAIKSLDNDIAIEASKIMESVMPGTEMIERTGLKSNLDEIVNDPNFEILPFDRKADLLKSMYITMGNNLAKKGLGTTENLLALKEQLDFNYLGKFYVNPDNTISAFALKQYAEQQIPEIDKKISELSKLYKDQQAAGNMAGGYYENPETGERMPTGEAMVKFQEAKDNLEKIKELPDDEQSGAFSDFMQGFMSTSAAQKTPFLASLLKVGKVGSLYNSAIAAKQTEADDALLTTEAMLQSYSDQTKDQRSIWYNAGVGTAESVPFMGEFMLTMGVGRGTVKGLEKIAEKKIKDYAESSTRKYLLKPLFETVGTLAQTTANPQQVAANTIERMVPEMQLAMSEDGDRIISEVDRNTGESFDEAFAKGFGKTWTEFFVERAGSALPFYTKGLSSKILPKSPDFVKRAFISFYMRKTGSNIGQAYTKLKNVGWDGLLAEFGEELAVMPMENFITGDYKDPAAGPYSSVLNGIIDPKTGNVDVDNLKTIAISVSAMTLPMIGGGMVVNSMPGAKTNVELFDINGNAYRASIRNDIFRSVIGLYRKDPKALDKWISETMPSLNLSMDETFVVNKLVDALKNKSAQDRMPGTTISEADKKLIDEVEKALNKEQPLEGDTEESVNASKEEVLSEATPTTIDETNIVPSVASPENVEEIVVGEAALPIEKTEPSVTSTDNIKPIINEQSVIANTTLNGLTEMENTIGGDNEIRTLDTDIRSSEDFTYINYEGEKTTDKKHNITSLPKYRIFKAKNGKQYIQVAVAASDAIGRKGGASVIFEMTGDMTPEIEQAIFNLKASDYKDGNVIRREGVSKFKNDLINIFKGEATLPVQQNAPDVASPVNSAPPVVEQTTVDDGGVTAPVVSLTETTEGLATSPENVALKDVESTAKALEGKNIENLSKKIGVEPSEKVSESEDFETATKTILTEPNKGIANLMLGKETEVSQKQDVHTHTYQNTGRTLNWDLSVYENSKGQKRYVLYERKYPEQIDAAALVDKEGNVLQITTSKDFRKIGLAQTLLSEIKSDIGKIIPSEPISKAGKKALDDFAKKQISEAYHKAKVDGSNPELVKAVEELLGEATVAETISSPDATAPVQEVIEPVTEAAPKVASPARETKLQKRVREARERIQAKKTASEKKAELETIRAERAESRAKKEQISKLRTRTPKNVTEGVLRYFADGGKIGEAAFRKEVMDNDAEFKNRKGRIIANAKDISDNPNTDFNDLDSISMRIAEDMQVPAEIYDETVEQIKSELIDMSLSIQSRNDAEASLTESYERELMQAEMSKAEFDEYEAEQKFLKGEARLDDYYSEDQLKEMSDAQKMADAVSIMEQTGSIPANTPTRRDKIKSEIDKIKDDIRKMSSGRLSSLPVDLFPKYVQLAAKYMELYGYDAYQFLAALKADGTDMGLPDDYLLSAHDKAVSEMKTSKFARTVQNAGKGISEKTKSEFSETGSTYTPITVRDTAKTAFEAWNEILERNNGDLEAAVWEAEQIVLRDDWGASPEQIGVLAGIVAEKMNELSKVEGLTIEQKNGYELRATNVFVKVRQRLTKAGQEASVVGKFMKEYFMAYPEAVTSFVYTSIDERNDTLVGVPGTEFTGTMMEIISEIMSTEAGMNAMMQLGIGKQGKIKKKYDKKQKAVSDAFDRVINDIDSFASGVSFAVPIPPSVIKTALKAMKKAIVSGLEVAKAVEIAVNSVKSEMKGVSFDADKAKAWFTGIADTILTDAEKNSDPEYVLSKMQEKLIKEQAAKVERAKKALEKYEAAKIEREEKERIAKEAADEAKAAEKAAKDADRQAKKEAADEAKAAEKAAKDAERLANAQRRKADAELERYNSALNNLKGNKLRQFAFNLAKNLPNGSGVINESMIVRAFQQANGGFQLTAKQQAELHQLAQVIANAYQSNRNALSASPNNSQFINSWIQTQYNAAQAAAKISQMLNPKRWVDMVNNAIVMNFMTFKTLGANPISNAIHKLYSAAYDDLLFSFVDVLYAPGQKSTFKERFKALFNIKPTVSWAKQLPDSVKRAWDIMKEGSPVEDADRYGVSYTMKPLEAWQNISARASATNGFLPKVNSIAKDVYEGTFGVVPAFISRSLSSGDVVFRDPEAARVYQKWADDLGVDIDEFLTSEEFSEYRYYALEYAKRITFQQENVVSKVAGKAISKIRNKGIVDWLKVLFVKPVMPFFGTPINIKHEMLTMIPPISFSESLHHASVAKNKKLSDAERFFHAKLSQKMMRRAVGSIPLYYAASALLASGIISIIPGAIGDDDDAKERLNREAFEGKSGRVKIKNRNATIDGLKFGPLFDYLILVDAVNREYDRTGDEFNVILKGLVSTTKSTIDNTYLQGLKNVMEAATDPERNLQSLLINTYGSAYANILFPNIMSDLTRMMDKEKVLRQTKDESFVKSLYNKVIRERIGFIKSDYTDIEQLPSRVNVLGEPIRTDRDGVMDIFHYMFDMSRAQVYEPEKKAQLQIYKNFLKTDDKAWLYPIAPARVKFESESVKLDPVLRNEYQRILGQTLSKALGKKNLKSLDLKAFEKMKLKAQEESAKSFVEKYGDRLSELKKKQAEEKKRNPERDILK